MRRISATRLGSRGFTLVELVIAMPLALIIITVFVATLFITLQWSSINQAQLELNSDNQTALTELERDVRYSNTFAKGLLNASFIDNNKPVSGWSYRGTSATNRVLILRSYATNEHPFSNERESVYVNGTIANPYAPANTALNCNSNLRKNPQLPYMIIYFVASNTLYRRILVDKTTTLCSGSTSQFQQQSCPEAAMASPCTVKDEVIVKNVSEFRIDYQSYSMSSTVPVYTTLDAYAATSPDDITTEATDINITIKLQKTANYRPVSSTFSLHVSRINNFE